MKYLHLLHIFHSLTHYYLFRWVYATAHQRFWYAATVPLLKEINFRMSQGPFAQVIFQVPEVQRVEFMNRAVSSSYDHAGSLTKETGSVTFAETVREDCNTRFLEKYFLSRFQLKLV